MIDRLRWQGLLELPDEDVRRRTALACLGAASSLAGAALVGWLLWRWWT